MYSLWSLLFQFVERGGGALFAPRPRPQRQRQRHCELFSNLVTEGHSWLYLTKLISWHLTFLPKTKNIVGLLCWHCWLDNGHSESDLDVDSIWNSCDVYDWYYQLKFRWGNIMLLCSACSEKICEIACFFSKQFTWFERFSPFPDPPPLTPFLTLLTM